MTRPSLLLPLPFLALAAMAGCGEATRDAPDGAVRNVLLITVDTLRADHLSCYGYPHETSPGLDAFLAQGTRFQNAFSTSCRTAPSHTSLLTGLYPSFNSVDVENGKHPLQPQYLTLAEVCRQAGLRTSAIISNPVLSARTGLNQGFETYDDRMTTKELNRDLAERVATEAVAEATRRLGKIKEQPFFLWLHVQDPHGPYTPPAEFREVFPADAEGLPVTLPAGTTNSGYGELPKYQLLEDERRPAEYRRRYDGEIRYLDQELGRFLGQLRDEGLLESTLVVLTADHGEAMGDGGFWFGHGHGLGFDQTHVPLAFVGPGVPAGQVLHSAVSAVDVFDTVLDALGLVADGQRQSRSLWADIQAGREPVGRVGFAESVSQRASFSGDLYLHEDRRPASDTEFWSQTTRSGGRYYPLGEPQAVALDGGAPDETLRGKLARSLADFGAQADAASGQLDGSRGPEREMDAEEIERLKALGYIEGN